MAKNAADTVIKMVKRAYGHRPQANTDHVATDFTLEISEAEKRQLETERREARSRLLASG